MGFLYSGDYNWIEGRQEEFKEWTVAKEPEVSTLSSFSVSHGILDKALNSMSFSTLIYQKYFCHIVKLDELN